ncbi:hypothetical protein [Streptomyces sp. NPDC003996]
MAAVSGRVQGGGAFGGRLSAVLAGTEVRHWTTAGKGFEGVDLVARGLAKNPAERPAHAEEFVRELEVVAGAAYGPDWEERGREVLATLVALLSLLLPSGRTSPASTTDVARTVLRQPSAGGRLRPWLPGRVGLVLSAALVLLGVWVMFSDRWYGSSACVRRPVSAHGSAYWQNCPERRPPQASTHDAG